MSGTTPINIIPTLDLQSILSNPTDILGYVIRYYTTAPQSISDTTPHAMISLANDVSRYQNSPDTLVGAVTRSLQSVLQRYFPAPSQVTVDVSTSDNGDGSYDLTILLAVTTNGNNYSLGANVSVNATGRLQLKFTPNFPSL
jgi:hypothetical protein